MCAMYTLNNCICRGWALVGVKTSLGGDRSKGLHVNICYEKVQSK